jgi:O-antigen ligase
LKSRATFLDLRVILRPFGVLFCFEAVFVFFLASVNYKADPRLLFIPIDLTLFFLALGAAMGLMIMFREGVYLPGLTVVSLFFVFVAWAMTTNLWTPSKIYAPRKLLELATLTLWSIIATAMIVANRPERLRRFLLLLLVFATAASVDGIIQYTTTGPFAGSASFRLENYISQGRFYGMGALVAFAAWLQTSPFSKRGMVLMAAFVICWYGLLISGGRSPILGVLASMMLPLALGLRFAGRQLVVSKAAVVSIGLFLLMAIALVQVAADYSENLRAFDRFNVLFSKEQGAHTARLEYWRAAWHFWLDHPVFGNGIASFPVRYFGFDVDRHPHNLILEVLVEFGLIGLLLLAGLAVTAVRGTSVRRLREDPVLMCAAMLCISMFLSAMTSSDITGNRNFFALLGLLVMRPYSRHPLADTESRARDQRRSILSQRVPDLGGGSRG